jgi:hypothetical protein
MNTLVWDFTRMIAILLGPMVVGLPMVALMQIFFTIVGEPG